jgi:hypothetical protein
MTGTSSNCSLISTDHAGVQRLGDAQPKQEDLRCVRGSGPASDPGYAPYDAFGLIGTTFGELEWKTSIFFERAVPISPNAWYRVPHSGIRLILCTLSEGSGAWNGTRGGVR